MTGDDPELDHLLTCDAGTFASLIGGLSVAECERIARLILERTGGPRFERYLKRIAETMVPVDGSGSPDKVEDYYHAVRDMFPHIERDDGTLGRLCAIVVHLCTRFLEESTSQEN
jgi:hypothetical protein